MERTETLESVGREEIFIVFYHGNVEYVNVNLTILMMKNMLKNILY